MRTFLFLLLFSWGLQAQVYEFTTTDAEGLQLQHRILMDGEYIVEDITESFDNPDNSAFTRIISLSLRHGANVKYLVEQIQKDKNSSMFSFAKGISRILKKYIPDGTPASDKVCLDCGAAAVVFEEGCMICKNCGSSKCG